MTYEKKACSGQPGRQGAAHCNRTGDNRNGMPDLFAD